MVVLGEQVRSLAQGLQQTLDQLMEGQLQNTKYVVIIVVLGQETQSCVVVTGEDRGDQCPCGGVVNTVVPWCCSSAGKRQCRALAESMLSPSESLREVNQQLTTGGAQELIHHCNSLGQGVKVTCCL